MAFLTVFRPITLLSCAYFLPKTFFPASRRVACSGISNCASSSLTDTSSFFRWLLDPSFVTSGPRENLLFVSYQKCPQVRHWASIPDGRETACSQPKTLVLERVHRLANRISRYWVTVDHGRSDTTPDRNLFSSPTVRTAIASDHGFAEIRVPPQWFTRTVLAGTEKL